MMETLKPVEGNEYETVIVPQIRKSTLLCTTAFLFDHRSIFTRSCWVHLKNIKISFKQVLSMKYRKFLDISCPFSLLK